MKFILENKDPDSYEVYFSHQCDDRSFNRGAMKNIGFLAIKEKYPEDYKNISFVFNDVDTIPFNKIFDYTTTSGTVKHYYGFKFALGGIVVLNGGDFERINGFPSYWGWGLEDNILQKRCQRGKLKIDRSVFYKLGSPEILQLFDGVERVISKDDPRQMDEPNNANGLSTIRQLNYKISEKSPDIQDNVFVTSDFKMNYINVTHFQTYIPYNTRSFHKKDLRNKKETLSNIPMSSQTKDVIEAPNKWQHVPPTPANRKVQNSEQSVMDDMKANQIVQTNPNDNRKANQPTFNMNSYGTRRKGKLRFLR